MADRCPLCGSPVDGGHACSTVPPDLRGKIGRVEDREGKPVIVPLEGEPVPLVRERVRRRG